MTTESPARVNAPVDAATAAPMPGPINPPFRLMMGPGPINADPRVLRAMSAQLLGQYDPAFTAYMNEVMELYRSVFRTRNRWTFLLDGTSRAGIEAVLVSLLHPGERVLVPSFGRFGLLLAEIAERAGAEVHLLERRWGTVFPPEEIAEAIRKHRPKVLAICQGDTSTTMNQPLAEIGRICRENGVLSYVDATASIAGNALEADAWELDALSAGLQKCLGGPSGSAPLTLSEAAAEVIQARGHVERGIRPAGYSPAEGPRIASNYFDLSMVMAYWSEQRLNHHTEATTMLYGARECARIVLEEGLDACVARHRRCGQALAAGLEALGLERFGDPAAKMNNVVGVAIPNGVDGERVRADLLANYGIEIGTSFGPLHGKIWRIGTMGYNARREPICLTLTALASVLRRHGVSLPSADPVEAALPFFADGD
jgi:(S)-ureidoglycine-glyoxylate aminotransferase